MKPAPISGVYQIRNRLTGAVYIGASVNIYTRIRAHLGLLKKGQHDNLWLQSAWSVYGPSVFSFCILETVSPDDNLIEAERRWLEAVQARVPATYNMVPPREGPREARKRKLMAI